MVFDFTTQLIIEARLCHAKDIPLPLDLETRLLANGINVKELLESFDTKRGKLDD